MKRLLILALLCAGCATQSPVNTLTEMRAQEGPFFCFDAAPGVVSFAERAEFATPNVWTRFADNLTGTNICIPAGPPGLFRAGSRF